jgi:peptide deformylase
MGPDNAAPSVEQAAEAFAAEVAYWRDVRGESQRKLAKDMGFDPSYVSHIESGRHRPTEDFARRADEVLNAGNAIWRWWQEYDAARRYQEPQPPTRESRIRAQPAPPDEARARQASERMRDLGIVQDGAPILRLVAKPFDLPHEADVARKVIDRLMAFAQRIATVHVFGKGMGLAAPQIGIGRAAAIVRPVDHTAEPIVLLNPRIVRQSEQTDEQYEGCLSFFDVCGLVPRALWLEVEHVNLTGERRVTTFKRALARLVAHEIDHLHGRLYTDRMRPGVRPIPVEEYRGTGTAWTY